MAAAELGLLQLGLLALVAAVASAVNAVAGGGTLITFPTLIAVGIPPLHANITNNVALLPGTMGSAWTERAALAGQGGRLPWVLPAAALGGFVGAWLLMRVGDDGFEPLVPWLILAATALVFFGPRIKAWAHARLQQDASGAAASNRPVMAAVTGIGSIYSGFFGAGQGLVLLAALSIVMSETIPRINALRQLIVLAAKCGALAVFLSSAHVVWSAAAAMAVGAVAGGAVGGRFAARVKPEVLRWAVSVIGVIVALVYLVR